MNAPIVSKFLRLQRCYLYIEDDKIQILDASEYVGVFSEELDDRLKAKHGQIIAASQGYKSLDSCLNGVESVRKNAPDGTEKVEEDPQ